MTREEAIGHAKFVRNNSKDASIIYLESEVIDALLSSPWHSVEERMPEIVHRKAGKECSDPCLCINEDGHYLPLIYNESYDDDGPVYFWTKVTEIYDTDIEPDITHWMPIPELPKEKED